MKKWSLLKKSGIFFLIALYFGVIFSFAYGFRLKQINTPAYEELMSKIEEKYINVKEIATDVLNKTTELATATKDNLKETALDLSAKLQTAFASQSNVYGQEPQITSPVSELVDASYDTTETNSFQDQASGETVLTGGPYDIIYYNQGDTRWKDKHYGYQDTIGKYGCGPTTLAMVVSSLGGEQIPPDKMAVWANEHGYYARGSGSYHSIIPEGASKFGLKVENLGIPTNDTIIEALCTGKVIVALMSQGHFTNSGHFMLIRGVTLDGKVLIADPLSMENSLKAWDPNILVNELKKGAASGGPAWAISK